MQIPHQVTESRSPGTKVAFLQKHSLKTRFCLLYRFDSGGKGECVSIIWCVPLVKDECKIMTAAQCILKKDEGKLPIYSNLANLSGAQKCCRSCHYRRQCDGNFTKHFHINVEELYILKTYFLLM